MLRDVLSEREEELPPFVMGRLLSLMRKPGMVSLGPGEPDLPPPPGVIKAAQRALKERQVRYSTPQGLLELREALAKKLKKENRISVGPEQVVVTTGSTEGILLALLSTVDPGEGVLLPDPGFLSYKPAVEMLNGMPLSFPVREEDDFLYSLDVLRDRIVKEKTKVLILNSPSNPTGAVLPKKRLEEIADFAREHHLLILSDEAYEHFVYGAKHVSMGSLNGMEEHVLTLQTFSKTYALPGMRLGYAAGPEKVVKAMTKLHLFTTLTSPTIAQHAALQALKENVRVERVVKRYSRRRDYLIKRVAQVFPCVEPRGAFYLFPGIKEFGLSSEKFAELLVRKAKTLVVPGTEFGQHGEGYIRLSYATPTEQLKEGMDRIERVVRKL